MSEEMDNMGKLLEKQLADFREGRTALDEGLADLNERRARYIQESSQSAADETCQVMDSLADHLEKLLRGRPLDSSDNKTEAPAPQPDGQTGTSEWSAPEAANY
jgi:hypothetical protein